MVPDRPADQPLPNKKAHKKAQSLLANAARAYDANDYSKALGALREAFAIEPLPDVLYNIAQTCRESGREQESLVLYEQTLRYNPSPELKKDSERHLNELKPRLATGAAAAGKAAEERKDYVEASDAYARAYALQALPIYLFRRAEALRRAEKVEEAERLYTQYLAADGGGTPAEEARRQLGRILAQRAVEQAGQHLEAKEYVQAALSWELAYQQDPRPLYVFRKAEAMYQAGQLHEAKGEYERFLMNSRGAEELREQRERAQSRLAEFETEVRRQLGQLLGQHADEEANRHFEAKEYAQAAVSWDAAYQHDPRPLFVFRKAEALYRGGRQQPAKGEYQRFLNSSSLRELRDQREQAKARLAEIGRPVYQRPWFWVAVGGGVVAAVAIGVGLGLGLRPPAAPTVPPGETVYQPSF